MLAGLAVLAAALLLAPTQSSAATPIAPQAAAPPIALTEISHVCAIIGSDLKYQAVHCADLMKGVEGQEQVYYGRNEVFCQTVGGTLVACAGIHETTVIIQSTGLNIQESGVCGARFGHSACGLRRVENYTPGGFATNGPGACIVGAESSNDSVVVPDGNSFGPGSIVVSNRVSVDCSILV